MDRYDTNRLMPVKITLDLPKANTDLEIKALSHSVLTSRINCVGSFNRYEAMLMSWKRKVKQGPPVITPSNDLSLIKTTNLSSRRKTPKAM